MVELNFTDHANVLAMVVESQTQEKEERESSGDQRTFMLNTMWDDKIKRAMARRYLGEFDQITPILDQITGEMTNSDFAISVSPAGGGATEDTAETYAGLIRNIENISNADQIYSAVGETMVMCGLDGFEIVQKFLDANTFDQDLVFEPVSDWYKSVWFDVASIKQDKSDAAWGVKLKELPMANYKKRFPKGSKVSVPDNIDNITTGDTNNQLADDSVIVGQLYYKKPTDIKLVQMNTGAVFEDTEKFRETLATRQEAGEAIVNERTRKSWKVFSRWFDGTDFLNDEQETVFTYIPLIPAYGNYAIHNSKTKFSGKTKKLMDAQRGINFALSGMTEDAGLSGKDDIWMTDKQAIGQDYSQMNIDRKGVRTYSIDEEAPPPARMPAPQGSPQLQNAIVNFQSMLQQTGNMDDPSMGQNPGLQSGVALDTLIGQSNNGNVKWFKSMEICICHAYRVLVDAIPRVYDSTRQQRILGEDGTDKTVPLNSNVLVNGQIIEQNDLSKGVYDVTCEMGATFHNQQEKESERLISMLQLDPAMIEMSRDVLYKNQNGPGMNTLAKRARDIAIQNGTIGPDEWTEDEQAEIQAQQEAAQNQPPQEDPNLLIAQAEISKAQAENTNAETNKQEAQFNAQVKSAQVALDQDKVALEREKLQFDVQKFLKGQDDKFNVDAAKIDQGQQSIDLKAQQQQFDNFLKTQQMQQQQINDAINNLKTIQDASGDATIIGPGLIDNMKAQSDIVSDKQSEE